MAQKVLKGHDVQAHLQKVGGITMAQHMGGHLFRYTALPSCPFDYPLHAIGRKAYRPPSGILAVEQPLPWAFGFQIAPEAPYQKSAERDITVLAAFAPADVKLASIQIHILDMYIAELEVAKAATVEHCQHRSVPMQSRRL